MAPPHPERKGERIAKLLARAGVASRREVERMIAEGRVKIGGARLEELIEGVTIEGMHYGRIDANMERKTGRNQWLELTLTEGKNREVRRVLEYLGLQVSRLLRTSYGPFALGDIPRGSAVEIRQVDVERFVKSLKSSHVGKGPSHMAKTPR